ncbi:MAG: hypothetical protein ABI867_25375 [Kofleriaceae bacterium]
MERILAFTTLLLAPASAHAAHPPQAVKESGTALDRQFVASKPGPRGYAFARQFLHSANPPAAASQRATSRTIYLNHDGVILRPGDNDSSRQRSSIVSELVEITPWEIDDDMWDETVACMRDMYSRFDVNIVTEDPGDLPHIEAVFGGHPNDVGLPDEVAGVSPFAEDCSTIESSIVFTFTDVLPDDPQLMCEVMAQEIAHSYGLDHQLLAEDPMTYLEYDGDRSFQNEMADCGEFESRDCGINGSVCRNGQNSVALLTSRLGKRGAEDDAPEDLTTTGPEVGGCAASGSGGPLGLVGVMLALLLGRRNRRARK